MIKKVQYIDPAHITWKDHVLMCFGVSPAQIFMSSVQSAEIQDSLPISIQLSCLDPSGLKCSFSETSVNYFTTVGSTPGTTTTMQ